LNAEPILNVALNVPLSRLFDYLPPAAADMPAIGSRVRVGFGRRKLVGLVLGISEQSDVPAERLKRAEACLDTRALLPDEILWLVRFCSDYYHHPIGEVVAAALPVLLRKGADLYPTLDVVVATEAGQVADLESMRRRAPKQAGLLQTVLDAGNAGVATDALTEILPNWRRAASALSGKNLIETVSTRADDAVPPAPDPRPGPALNGDQRAAVAAVRERAGFAPYLLDGVTGSGKTEVYLHLIEDAIRADRQTLVLVPEIGLTPQLIGRFRTRLGIEPAVLHSALGDTERLAGWRRALSGDALLVVGTRSAIFTPLPRPGLIIVDEEHDHSFKQQEGLRYSARDLALVRAKRSDVPIVLGSATPSLEMLKHCLDDNYAHLQLPQRAGGANPPALHIVDIGHENPEDGLGSALKAAIERHLANDGQALLFLNRRGFAPTLICAGCGELAECRRCDSRMTVHAREGRLRCHHCGASRPLDEYCASCGSAFRTLGAGTERLEDALLAHFPGRRVTRIDSDSTQLKGAMDEALSAATLGEADILVGTQMLSKGHHFPQLTLVGVINADQGLFGTDFRSDERMAQSIVQVAGRAGRELTQGEVLIQTAFPQHPFWQRLIDSGYEGVAADALEERAATHWPPYSRLALLRSTAHQRRDAHAFLDIARRHAVELAPQSVRILGPVDAVMARKAGRYRAQLLLQTTDRQALHALLRMLRPLLEDDPAARKVRWSIDVDPVELF
jgi:primosomal protein N' (replication factor Y)